MPIDVKGGKARSKRTPEELSENLKKRISKLSPEERAALRLSLAELASVQRGEQEEAPLYQALTEAEYVREPVDIRTFVTDPYFLGATCDSIYPVYLDALVELFSGGYQEAILTGAIGIGKCVAAGTEVFDMTSGKRRVVEELGSYDVFSVCPTTGKTQARPAVSVPSGTKECVTIRLRTGEVLTLSTDHKVLTWKGWVPAGELEPGDRVATPRRVPGPVRALESFSDEEVKLAAYLLADGCVTSSSISFTNGDAKLLDEVRSLTLAVGASYENADRRAPRGLGARVRVQYANCTTLGLRGILPFLRKLGIRGHAREKRIPAPFYGLPVPQVALFLNRFWACDGTIYVTKRGQPVAQVTLASEGLVRDLKFLLLRLGVTSSTRPVQKSYTYGGERRTRDAWELSIRSADGILTFLDAVGSVLGKEEVCLRVREACSRRLINPNLDVVPVRSAEVASILRGTGIPKRRYGLVCSSYMSRPRFERMCAEAKYHGELSRYATDDIMWSPVAANTPAGKLPVYDLAVDSTHTFVANNVVVHNTYLASVGLCWILYELSCMRNPQRSFGLASDSNLSVVCFSVTEMLAIKVAFENIATKIRASPYFQEHFPFEVTKKELRFPHNIWVAARASTDSSALGLNVISGFVDEGNFFHDAASSRNTPGFMGRAEALYAQIQRRMKSRFERFGRLPGMLFVVSSKKTNEDFTNKRITANTQDPSVFVIDFALWEVKPEVYTSQVFRVLCGNETIPSQILTDEEYERLLRAGIPEGVVIADVPEDFRPDFERDLEGSIRDLAGISTVAVHPYIQQRDKILAAVDKERVHPFSSVSYDMSVGGQFLWGGLVCPSRNPQSSTPTEPILNPRIPRHIHIDTSLRRDATGFAMSHVPGYVFVKRRGRDGNEYTERAPLYVVDFMLQVVPPAGREILLSDIRHLVYDLAAKGFNISLVTLDSYQSQDTIQQLTQRGFNAKVLSVDVTPEPYDTLKTALYEDRIRYYAYEPLLAELRKLEEHSKGRVRKIDHPGGGSKDVADAVAGTIFSLSQGSVYDEPLPMLTSGMGVLPGLFPALGGSVEPALLPFGGLPAFLLGGRD